MSKIPKDIWPKIILFGDSHTQVIIFFSTIKLFNNLKSHREALIHIMDIGVLYWQINFKGKLTKCHHFF